MKNQNIWVRCQLMNYKVYQQLMNIAWIQKSLQNLKKSTISIEDALQSQLNMMTKEEALNMIKHNQCGQGGRDRGGWNNNFDQCQGYNGRTKNRGEGDSNQHHKSQIQCHKYQKYDRYRKNYKSHIQCHHCKRFDHY